jgi:uncharacterized protein YdeI (BOF family)
MLRILVSAATVFLTLTPALADNHGHSSNATTTAEEIASRGTPYNTSTALSDAAHNAVQNQQGASVTQHGATQTGIVDLGL